MAGLSIDADDINADGNVKEDIDRLNIENSGDSSRNIHDRRVVYEVIIHAGEAYLKMKELNINIGDKTILDYSTGWQHSVLVLSK
jgi:hypothetical protein